MKIVNDERICDGYYYANSMRMLRRLLMNPAMLLEPPEKGDAGSGGGQSADQ